LWLIFLSIAAFIAALLHAACCLLPHSCRLMLGDAAASAAFILAAVVLSAFL